MVYSNDKIHMCLHTKQPSNHKQTHHMITTSVSCDLVLQTMSMCVCVCLCQSMPDLGNHCHSLVPHAKGRDKWRSCAPFPFLLNTKNPVYHHGHYYYTIEALSCKVVINSWLWLLAIGKVHQLQNTYQHILQFLRGFASSDLLSAERKVQSLQS